jgi:hypothetical protein
LILFDAAGVWWNYFARWYNEILFGLFGVRFINARDAHILRI